MPLKPPANSSADTHNPILLFYSSKNSYREIHMPSDPAVSLLGRHRTEIKGTEHKDVCRRGIYCRVVCGRKRADASECSLMID